MKPTTILVGDGDQIVNATESALVLHRAIATSTLLQLPNTNHTIPRTRPNEVINAICLTHD